MIRNMVDIGTCSIICIFREHIKHSTKPAAQIYDEEEKWITNKNIDFSKCICLYCKIDLEKTSDAAINKKLRDLNKDTRTIELMKEKFIKKSFTTFYDS